MNYPFVYYVDTLDPGVVGNANGPIIHILKSHKDDAGAIPHEFTHVKQWFVLAVLTGVILTMVNVWVVPIAWWAIPLPALFLHQLLYAWVAPYRQWAEVQAFREEAKHYPDDRLPQFAFFIAANYGLKITQADALKRLKGN